MVPCMEVPGIEPTPESRGPLITLLTQLYTETEVPGDNSTWFPDASASLVDLVLMFTTYVRDTGAAYGGGAPEAVDAMARMFVEYARTREQEHGGNFQDFLQRQAVVPYLPDEPA